MNILDRIQNSTGLQYKKTATTMGGEYSGPCPWCGGDDRFSIHPNTDHYVCRGCRKAGDSIKWLRDHDNQSYFEACKTLKIQPNTPKFKSLNTATEQPGQNELVWTPREPAIPSLTWCSKAEQILFSAYKHLLSPSGAQHRAWLNNRGISNSTIKAARLGLLTRSLSFDRESWGLPPEKNQNGKNKQIWLPGGLIIPYFQNGLPARLRIRQDNPISSDRYIIVSGSSTAFFDYRAHQITTPGDSSPLPYICTESELDGWLIHQEAGSLVDVFSIGNAQSRPDLSTHQQIKNKPGLINLDNDAAGNKEQAWWKQQYPHSKPWVSSFGKDPGEDFDLGVDIQQWVQTGIASLDMQGCSAAGPEKFDRAAVIATARKKLEAQHAVIAEKLEIKTVEVEKPVAPAQPPQPRSAKDCIHGHYCVSHKNGVCLVAKQTAFSLPACPNDKWYKYFSDNGLFSEIILGMKFKA